MYSQLFICVCEIPLSSSYTSLAACLLNLINIAPMIISIIPGTVLDHTRIFNFAAQDALTISAIPTASIKKSYYAKNALL